MTAKQFDRDNFADLIGSSFTLKAEGDVTAELVLTHVSELRESSGCRGFSIEFLAAENWNVAQGLYDVEHATLGTTQLFLVPVGMKNGQLQLQSIFNLLIDDEANA